MSMSVGLLICVWCPRVKFTVEDSEENEGQGSGLLVELEGKEEKKKHETDLWFSKVCFIVWNTRNIMHFCSCPCPPFFLFFFCWFTCKISSVTLYPSHCLLSRAFSLRLTWREMPWASSGKASGYKTNKQVAFLFMGKVCDLNLLTPKPLIF